MAHEVMIGAYSAYAIAVKHGYEGTEAEWIAAQEAARVAAEAAAAEANATLEATKETLVQVGDNQRELIAAKGADTLATIPADYTAMHEQVQRNKADILVQAPAVVENASAPRVTITDGAARPALSLISHIAHAQEGEGDPAPDNVRPISGWDAVTLVRAGRNLLRFPYPKNENTHNGVTFATDAEGRIYANGTAGGSSALFNLCGTGNMLTLIPGVKYRFSGLPAASTQNTYFIRMQDATRTQTFDITGTGAGFTPKFSQYYVFVAIMPGVTVNNIAIEPMLTFDSGAYLSFEPSHGDVLAAAMPEAVYGGSFDWTSGLLTVTHIIKTIRAGDVYYRYDNTQPEWQTTAFAINADNRLVTGAMTSTCSHFTNTNGKAFNPAAARKGMFSDHPTNTMKYFAWGERGGTEDDFKAWLEAQYTAGTPVQIVCKLADPYTIQLTPQQLDMLKGYNALWSDTGDTHVSYIADTRMYIDNAIAAIAAANLNV